MAGAKVQVRRASEDPAEGDGTRVRAGRIWPRGLTKARAALDEWCKEIAPSTGLRKWHGHDPSASGNSAAATRRNWQSQRPCGPELMVCSGLSACGSPRIVVGTKGH
jgi:uncharacterized protein YeaO (DUF488 family)